MINLVVRIAIWLLFFFRAKPGSLERARLALPVLMYAAIGLIFFSIGTISLIENELIRNVSYGLLGLGVFGGFIGTIIWGFYRLHQRDEFDRQLRARDARLLKKKGVNAQ